MSSKEGQTVIEFRDVVRTYGEGEALQYAVNHINFTIDKGEFVVILGQSGAGKSTVLNMLGGMDQPTEGEVIIDGATISNMRDKQLSDYRAEKIGFIFQFYNLIPTLTAYENVALTKSIVKNAASADEMLAAVGLADHKDKFPSQLSGGEQQRVSIARALAKKPQIILGDEPTGALDSETGVIVLELLQKLGKEHGNTVVIVTHNADIAKCADKVIRMKNGKISEIVINENSLPVRAVSYTHLDVYKRQLFLQIVYGRTQSAFSEDGLAIGAGLEDLGKGLRSQVGTMYGTLAKGPRYLEMAEGYVTGIALDEHDEIIGYQFVSLGKMTDFIKSGDTPTEAWEKAKGQYGRVADAAKIIDPRKE